MHSGKLSEVCVAIWMTLCSCVIKIIWCMHINFTLHTERGVDGDLLLQIDVQLFGECMQIDRF